VLIGNGDSVAALESWQYPNAFDAVRPEHVDTVQAMVRSNDSYRADPQSPDWIGRVIADVVGLDAEADDKTIKTIIKTWLENKVLYKHNRKDETRHFRVFITADPPKDTEREAQERRERFRVVDNKPETAKPEPATGGVVGDVLRAWATAFGVRSSASVPFLADEVMRFEPNGWPDQPGLREIQSALLAVAEGEPGKIDSARLEQWLRENSGVEVGHLTLLDAGTDKDGLAQWAVRLRVEPDNGSPSL
jgi:hypothetical protein